MRTLEERIKFEHSLSPMVPHCITLVNATDQCVVCLATIGKIVRGKSLVRLEVAEGMFITTYKVRGNDLEYEGRKAQYVYQQQWNELTANPLATVSTY